MSDYVKALPGSVLRRVRAAKLRLIARFLGKSYFLRRWSRYSAVLGSVECLRILGARIGQDTIIRHGIRLINAMEGDCHNLQIGNRVYIGPDCLFDLTEPITIEDEVSLAPRVSIITHFSVGHSSLNQRLPAERGPVVVERGAWIGVNSTVLHGVRVGAGAAVGAMSLVNRDVPRDTGGFGVPFRIKRRFSDRTSTEPIERRSVTDIAEPLDDISET